MVVAVVRGITKLLLSFMSVSKSGRGGFGGGLDEVATALFIKCLWLLRTGVVNTSTFVIGDIMLCNKALSSLSFV